MTDLADRKVIPDLVPWARQRLIGEHGPHAIAIVARPIGISSGAPLPPDGPCGPPDGCIAEASAVAESGKAARARTEREQRVERRHDRPIDREDIVSTDPGKDAAPRHLIGRGTESRVDPREDAIGCRARCQERGACGEVEHSVAMHIFDEVDAAAFGDGASKASFVAIGAGSRDRRGGKGVSALRQRRGDDRAVEAAGQLDNDAVATVGPSSNACANALLKKHGGITFAHATSRMRPWRPERLSCRNAAAKDERRSRQKLLGPRQPSSRRAKVAE